MIIYLASHFTAAQLIEFSRRAIQLRNYSIFQDNLFWLIIQGRYLLIGLIGILLYSYPNRILIDQITNSYALFNLIAGLLVIGYGYKRGNLLAKYLFIGVLVNILGVGLMILSMQELIQGVHPFLFVQAGIVGQGLIITWGSGRKIQENLKKEKEVQATILRMEKQVNEKLERKVQERTLDLQRAYNGINSQNEELQQKQEEILTQRDFIEKKNKELGIINAKISNSIRAALTIQEAILPYPEKLDALLIDYFILFKPRDIVSGDFFWLEKVNGKKILAAVDCTGHGVPGAFMSLIGHTLLDKIIRLWQITDPGQILNLLHQEVQI
ncbi:MAG: hypothetical protein AAFU64_21075, partial [Bacteroidota bacterium]